MNLMNANKLYTFPYSAAYTKKKMCCPHKHLASFRIRHLKCVAKALQSTLICMEWGVPNFMLISYHIQSACFLKSFLCIHVPTNIDRKILSFVFYLILFALFRYLLQPLVVKQNPGIHVTKIYPVKMS